MGHYFLDILYHIKKRKIKCLIGQNAGEDGHGEGHQLGHVVGTGVGAKAGAPVTLQQYILNIWDRFVNTFSKSSLRALNCWEYIKKNKKNGHVSIDHCICILDLIMHLSFNAQDLKGTASSALKNWHIKASSLNVTTFFWRKNSIVQNFNWKRGIYIFSLQTPSPPPCNWPAFPP